jgi:hypothetical protein
MEIREVSYRPMLEFVREIHFIAAYAVLDRLWSEPYVSSIWRHPETIAQGIKIP